MYLFVIIPVLMQLNTVLQQASAIQKNIDYVTNRVLSPIENF